MSHYFNIIEQLQSKYRDTFKEDISRSKIKFLTDELFSTIIETLAEEDYVNIRDFGRFKKVIHKERSHKNNLTNEEIYLPVRLVPKFYPGKGFKRKISNCRIEEKDLESDDLLSFYD